MSPIARSGESGFACFNQESEFALHHLLNPTDENISLKIVICVTKSHRIGSNSTEAGTGNSQHSPEMTGFLNTDHGIGSLGQKMDDGVS